MIAQIVGIAAVIFALSIFQFNKRSAMLWLGLIAGILFSLHFFLLGAFTGAAINLISVTRSYAFIKVKPTRENTWILLLFISLAGIATIMTWRGPIGLLAFIGNTASGIAFWQRKPSSIRRWAYVPPPFWFSYNALSGSYPGMFIETFDLISLIIGTYRFDWRKKQAKNTNNLRVISKKKI